MRRLIGILLAAAIPSAYAAEGGGDLSRIPDAMLAPAETEGRAAPVSDWTGTFYLEEAPEALRQRRNLAVPVPGGPGPDTVNRFYGDGRLEWRLSDGLTAHVSDRLNFELRTPRKLSNNFREGYLGWSVTGETFVDLGRINVKNGVAYAFNPTDFFKARAVVDEFTNDPSVLRENRLGTFMLRAQQVFSAGSVTALYAPKLEDPPPVNAVPASFHPNFNRTNAGSRFLLKANWDLARDFSPEILLLRQDAAWKFGANLTRGLGSQTTGYVEWAGGRQVTLAEEAYRFALRSGTLPGGVPPLFPGSRNAAFRSDLAVGFSTTTSYKLNLVVEYDYHQAGFTGGDWRNWFRLGTRPQAPSLVPAELWLIRAYASDQHVPLSRHSIFARAQWDDGLIQDLSLSALAIVNPVDGSRLGQAEADYKLSDRWYAGFLAQSSSGARRSAFGSNPTAAGFILTLSHYF